MKRDDAYFVGMHRYLFKSGVPAKIIGVEMITPKGLPQRLCYHIRWTDAAEDWVPVEDHNKTYKIISFEDILAGNIPKVTK
jgi:hypothetical protein